MKNSRQISIPSAWQYLLFLAGLSLHLPIWATTPNTWLADSDSAYFQAHANNSIHWQPWSQAVFARAKRENKPLFVSIGHQGCNWCTAMNTGAFANHETGVYMNAHFINVLVDSQSQISISRAFEKFYEDTKGIAGFPMNVWITPDGIPFFGKFYLGNLLTVATEIVDKWENEEKLIRNKAGVLKSYIEKKRAEKENSLYSFNTNIGNIYLDRIENIYQSRIQSNDDSLFYPDPAHLYYLLQSDSKGKMLGIKRLNRFINSALYDHLAGGFFRAAHDADWLFPVFEKNLETQALLIGSLIAAYDVSAYPPFKEKIEASIDFVLQYFISDTGKYYDNVKATDNYYLWDQKRMETALIHAVDQDLAQQRYNFDSGQGIVTSALYVKNTLSKLSQVFSTPVKTLEQRLSVINARLLKHRQSTAAPAHNTDIKISTNALFLRTLANAGRVLKNPTYLLHANKLAHQLTQKETLTAIKTQAQYATLINGLLMLHKATDNKKWEQQAHQLMQKQIQQLWDDEKHCFNDQGQMAWLIECRFDDGHSIAASSLNVQNLLILSRHHIDMPYLNRAMTLAHKALNSVEGRIELIPYLLIYYQQFINAKQWITLDNHD